MFSCKQLRRSEGDVKQVSIGICCYNEEANIDNLLKNLRNSQGLQTDTEIFVVCSGCTDSTVQIVRKYLAIDPRIYLIIEKERKGKASAINKILKRCRGRYIFLIPGDVLPEENCLPLLIDFLTSHDEIGVVERQ